jgi:hypothetical protein
MTEISHETYEHLRRILEKQNSQSYSLEEAKEIGDGLLDFFMAVQQIVNSDEAETTDN